MIVIAYLSMFPGHSFYLPLQFLSPLTFSLETSVEGIIIKANLLSIVLFVFVFFSAMKNMSGNPLAELSTLPKLQCVLLFSQYLTVSHLFP